MRCSLVHGNVGDVRVLTSRTEASGGLLILLRGLLVERSGCSIFDIESA